MGIERTIVEVSITGLTPDKTQQLVEMVNREPSVKAEIVGGDQIRSAEETSGTNADKGDKSKG